jgi:dolichyl-phosphate-mannose--protein O-mannosyl transferase
MASSLSIVPVTATVAVATDPPEASPATASGIANLPPPVDPGQEAVPAPLRPWHGEDKITGWFITIIITGLAAFTRLWDVGIPSNKMFDEAYYATEAQEMLRWGYESNPGFMFIVHPPIGKWLIALSSAVWGDNSTGWRVAPAIAGTLCVFLIIRIARRMFRSNLLGGIAGLLLTMEGISLVLSRTALLDIFLQLFVLAGFGALVVDRDQMRGRLARFIAEGGDPRTYLPALGPRPWRLIAGVMLGVACAVKWSALSFLIFLVILSLLWDRGAFKSAGVRSPWSTAFRRSYVGAFFSLFLAPIGAYLLSWLGWWAGENSWNRHWADTNSGEGPLGWLPGWLQSLLHYHDQAYKFHESLTQNHPYQANPWTWLIMGRPVPFAYYGTPDGVDDHARCGAAKCASEVLLIGTPLMWWAFTPAVIWCLWHWATTRDWRAGSVLLAFIPGWLVWLRYGNRTMFVFYTAPLIPFLVIGLTLALGTLLGPARTPSLRLLWYRPNWRVFGVAAYLGVVVADFIWMWPIFTNVTLTWSQWHARIWFQSWI